MSIEYVELTITDAEPIQITISDIPEAASSGGGLEPIAANRLLGNLTGSTALPTGQDVTAVRDWLDYRTGNTLFVDAETGNDSTGTATGSKPYATCLAAETAASSGDLIVVRPGSYSGNSLGTKTGINWYWQRGAVYTQSAASLGAVWAISGNVRVRGYGRFVTTLGSGLLVTSNAADCLFEADEIVASSAGVQADGKCIVKVHRINSTAYDAVITSSTNAGSVIVVDVDEITSDSDAVTIENTVTPTTRQVVRIKTIVSCATVLNVESEHANTTVVIDNVGSVGTDTIIDSSTEPSHCDLFVFHWPYATPPVTNAIRFFALDKVRDASAIDSGTLADARLSANIPRMVGGLIQASNLPSYVDDVLEFANLASFPVTGETGKIYVALNTNLTYRWSGSAYVEISPSTAVWGSISGTLSSQTDLQNALNAKLNTSIGTTADLLIGTGTAGAIETRTVSQVRTLLGLATTDSPTFAGVTTGQGSASATAINTGTANTGIWFQGGNNLSWVSAGVERVRLGSGGRISATDGIALSGTAATPHVTILGDAANISHQRNGTAGQIARWAKTWNSLTNNELFEIDCAGNAATFDLAVCSGSAGGTNRGLRIGQKFAGGAFSSWLNFDTSGGASFAGFADVTGSVFANNANALRLTNRVWLTSPSSGVLTITDQSFAAFSRINLGLATSTFPAIKRNGTTVEIRLADDSGFSDMSFRNLTASGNQITLSGLPTTNPGVAGRLWNDAGTLRIS